MKAKASSRENYFAPGTSRKREGIVTLRNRMTRDTIQLLEMGERIKELRKASGLKQQFIADYCDVKLRTYQFWQQGKHPPEQENLEKLAELFGVTPQFIMRGETPEPFATNGRAEQLDRIELVLHGLAQRIDQLEQPKPSEPLEAQTAEEVLDEIKTATRALEQLLGRIGENVGRRELESRRAKDRQPERPSAAA